MTALVDSLDLCVWWGAPEALTDSFHVIRAPVNVLMETTLGCPDSNDLLIPARKSFAAEFSADHGLVKSSSSTKDRTLRRHIGLNPKPETLNPKP